MCSSLWLFGRKAWNGETLDVELDKFQLLQFTSCVIWIAWLTSPSLMGNMRRARCTPQDDVEH